MRYNSKIHSTSHLLKSILGNVEKMSGGLKYPNDELIVVNYHSTPKNFIESFEKQIEFYKKHFNVINPLQLENYYENKLISDKCNLLITFDDGLKNNLLAAEVLERQNMSALFFIVPAFIDTPIAEQKQFYLKNIRPVVNENIDHEPEDFTAMSWDDLKQLKGKGHVMGCHTYSHALSVKHTDQKNSEKEILQSKSKIEEMLREPINSFCSINNTLESVGSFEKKLIKENYSFHFTTFPGSNSENKDPLFIKRRNVEVFWLMGSLYYALGKRDLPRWKKFIEDYNKL